MFPFTLANVKSSMKVAEGVWGWLRLCSISFKGQTFLYCVWEHPQCNNLVCLPILILWCIFVAGNTWDACGWENANLNNVCTKRFPLFFISRLLKGISRNCQCMSCLLQSVESTSVMLVLYTLSDWCVGFTFCTQMALVYLYTKVWQK